MNQQNSIPRFLIILTAVNILVIVLNIGLIVLLGYQMANLEDNLKEAVKTQIQTEFETMITTPPDDLPDGIPVDESGNNPIEDGNGDTEDNGGPPPPPAN